MAAAMVINARTLIMAIEQEGSNLTFGALGQCNGAVQVDGLRCAPCSSPGRGSGGEYSSLPAPKVDKKMMHQSISTAGGKEVGGKVEALDKKRWRTR